MKTTRHVKVDSDQSPRSVFESLPMPSNTSSESESASKRSGRGAVNEKESKSRELRRQRSDLSTKASIRRLPSSGDDGSSRPKIGRASSSSALLQTMSNRIDSKNKSKTKKSSLGRQSSLEHDSDRDPPRPDPNDEERNTRKEKSRDSMKESTRSRSRGRGNLARSISSSVLHSSKKRSDSLRDEEADYCSNRQESKRSSSQSSGLGKSRRSSGASNSSLGSSNDEDEDADHRKSSRASQKQKDEGCDRDPPPRSSRSSKKSEQESEQSSPKRGRMERSVSANVLLQNTSDHRSRSDGTSRTNRSRRTDDTGNSLKTSNHRSSSVEKSRSEGRVRDRTEAGASRRSRSGGSRSNRGELSKGESDESLKTSDHSTDSMEERKQSSDEDFMMKESNHRQSRHQTDGEKVEGSQQRSSRGSKSSKSDSSSKEKTYRSSSTKPSARDDLAPRKTNRGSVSSRGDNDGELGSSVHTSKSDSNSKIKSSRSASVKRSIRDDPAQRKTKRSNVSSRDDNDGELRSSAHNSKAKTSRSPSAKRSHKDDPSQRKTKRSSVSSRGDNDGELGSNVRISKSSEMDASRRSSSKDRSEESGNAHRSSRRSRSVADRDKESGETSQEERCRRSRSLKGTERYEDNRDPDSRRRRGDPTERDRRRGSDRSKGLASKKADTERQRHRSPSRGHRPRTGTRLESDDSSDRSSSSEQHRSPRRSSSRSRYKEADEAPSINFLSKPTSAVELDYGKALAKIADRFAESSESELGSDSEKQSPPSQSDAANESKAQIANGRKTRTRTWARSKVVSNNDQSSQKLRDETTAACTSPEHEYSSSEQDEEVNEDSDSSGSGASYGESEYDEVQHESPAPCQTAPTEHEDPNEPPSPLARQAKRRGSYSSNREEPNGGRRRSGRGSLRRAASDDELNLLGLVNMATEDASEHDPTHLWKEEPKPLKRRIQFREDVANSNGVACSFLENNRPLTDEDVEAMWYTGQHYKDFRAFCIKETLAARVNDEYCTRFKRIWAVCDTESTSSSWQDLMLAPHTKDSPNNAVMIAKARYRGFEREIFPQLLVRYRKFSIKYVVRQYKSLKNSADPEQSELIVREASEKCTEPFRRFSRLIAEGDGLLVAAWEGTAEESRRQLQRTYSGLSIMSEGIMDVHEEENPLDTRIDLLKSLKSSGSCRRLLNKTRSFDNPEMK